MEDRGNYSLKRKSGRRREGIIHFEGKSGRRRTGELFRRGGNIIHYGGNREEDRGKY